MECPVCKTRDLVMAERQGVEIDYCPQCRGVWLDRGELDKIIDRSQADVPAPQAQRSSAPPPGGDYSHGYSQPYHGYDKHGYDKKRKRKGLLSEIFDF